MRYWFSKKPDHASVVWCFVARGRLCLRLELDQISKRIVIDELPWMNFMLEVLLWRIPLVEQSMSGAGLRDPQ